MLVEGFLLVATLTLLYYLYDYVTSPANLPPGPIPLPIINNLLSITGSDSHLAAAKLANTYGDIFTLKIFNDRFVFVSSGAGAREVLMGKRMNDLAGRPQTFTFNFLTRGAKDIIFGDYSRHLVWRRKIVHSGLRMYFPKLEENIAWEVSKLERKLMKDVGTALHSRDEFSLLITNIISSFLLGKSFEPDDPDFLTTLEFTRIGSQLPVSGSILDNFPFLVHLPISESRFYKKLVEIRDRLLDKFFLEHKSTFSEDCIRDLTDAFLKAKLEVEREDKKAIGEVTDDHITMLMTDVYFAGLETTSTTLSWLAAYLINYPQVQTRLQTDIDDVIGSRWPVLADKPNLPYMEATIAEVLRIATVAPMGLPHKATTNNVPLMGYNIPKDTIIVMNLWAIHHDPREWPNPDKFDPDRFINEDGKFEVPGQRSYLPFSAGRRVCVGESLAKIELFLVMTRLLQQFTLETLPGQGPPSVGEASGNITRAPKPFKFRAMPRRK
ncbi:predicted protein [Nematostella vectensis]|uniref:Steroid 21-hydroxylase n=1 Tax=Nematostella vectensis TaxID=45351 RepID=A7S507_NEMVE|nr:predicted protein [Nematostella vectensis]|eukprot:XP_001633347.1 predicted protein [Nematostella vectensis]